MSDTPLFAKRTKSKTIRAREETGDIDSEESKTPVSNFKAKNKAKSKPQQRLSFNDIEEKDSDGEVFQVKKSSLSKKIKLGGMGASVPGLAASLEQTTLLSRSEGPKYDASYLAELKASTNSSRPPSDPQNGDNVNINNVDTEMTFDASEMDGAVIENLNDLPLLTETITTDTMIPSESAIKAAREKRDRMKKTGVPEQDFISLSITRREDNFMGPHPESRLMREDDDLGEGDDDQAEYTGAQERIALSKKGRKAEAKEKKKEMSELIEDADEQDEETMEWEMAQVKRAVPIEAAAQARSPQVQSYKAAPIPTPTPIPTLDGTITRLSTALSTLTTSHAKNTETLTNLADEQVRLETEEADLRRQVEQTETKRAWFQSFRDRVETVAEFLDEKFPGLEKLEEEHASLLTERAEMIAVRRKDDNEDDLVLLYGVPSDMVEEDTIDELGRAVPTTTAANSAVRRERRQARKQRHSSSASSLSISATKEEGYTTDSELSVSDAADFNAALDNLRTKLAELFSDVKAKAFKNPTHGIAIWFAEWKEQWPDIYHNAFGGMGLIQAWEFWARVELIGWLPFDVPPRIDEFNWYTQLYEYSRSNTNGEEDLRPEDDLPVNMCSTMLIPRLNALLLAGAFDPYSASQIPYIVDMAEQLEAYVGSDNIRYLSFLTSVARTFRKSATELTEQYYKFASHSNTGPDQGRNVRPTFDPETIYARQRFMNRTKKLIDNVMKWRRYAKERDGLGLIVSGLLEDALFPVAQEGWEVGGEECVRKVVGTMPQELVPASVRSRLG